MIQSILIASIGILASVITASLSYYFTQLQQIIEKERNVKIEYYKKFIHAMNDVAIDNRNVDAKVRLSEGFNTLILIGSSDVVEKLMVFHDYIKPENQSFNTVTHDELLTELVKSMREDMFGKRKSINKGFPGIHLVGGGVKS